MKKKLILFTSVVTFVAILIGAILYRNQTTLPKSWANRILTVDNTENHLSNWFDLYFTKNHAILVAKDSGNPEQKKTKLAKDILQAFSVKGNEKPEAGAKVDLGRVKTTKIDNGYNLATKKVTFIFIKRSDGAYQSQDGSVWQFSPEN